jgi:hypothetical protein
MTILPEDRRAESAREFGLWRESESKDERDKHLVRLWELCRHEIKRAVRDVAGGESSVGAWLDRRGLTFEEVSNDVFPAIIDAARRYDPGHESGASFPTFAMGHIKGAVVRIAKDSPPLAGHEGPEDRAQEELHAGELPPIPPLSWRGRASTANQTSSRPSTKRRSIRTNVPPRISAGWQT